MNTIPRLAILFALILPTGFSHLSAQEWQPVTSLPAIEMSALFSKGDTLFAAAKNKVYFTYNNGSDWDSTAIIDPGVDFVKTLFFNKGSLFAGTLTKGIYRSDNLSAWQADNSGLAGAGALDISSFANRGDSLYAGTYGAGVFVKKLSESSNWSSYSNGLPWFNVESLRNIDGKLYAGAGGNGTFSVNTYPNHSWVEKPFATFNGSLNFFLDVIRKDDVLLAAGMQGLYRSTDNGESWTELNPGTGILGFARLVDAGDKVIANLAKPAGFSFLMYSENEGLDWKTYLPELTGSYGFDIALSGHVLYSARSNGLWRIDLATPVHEQAERLDMLGPSFPNPFMHSTEIPVRLTQHTRLELLLFNENGDFIKSIWSGEKTAGDHLLSLYDPNLPAGVYFAVLTSKTGTQTRRMVLVK